MTAVQLRIHTGLYYLVNHQGDDTIQDMHAIPSLAKLFVNLLVDFLSNYCTVLPSPTQPFARRYRLLAVDH